MTLPTFRADARPALLDDAEATVRGEIAPQVAAQAATILRRYGRAHDYAVEPVIESADTTVRRAGGQVTVRWGWAHEAAPFFESGTSDHVVEGDPVLAFVWEDAPAAVAAQYGGGDGDGDGTADPFVVFSEVEVAGLPEARFIRGALAWLRRELR